MAEDACSCSRPSLLWRLKFGMLCGFGNKRKNLDYFLNLRLSTLRYFLIFWRSWIYWTTFEVAISTWSILFLQQLRGLVPATPEHSGQPPLRSRSSPLGLSSLSPDETVEDQHGQPCSGSYSLGCGAVAPMPLQIDWTQHHLSRRLRRTLCTWSIFHLGTKGVSFS